MASGQSVTFRKMTLRICWVDCISSNFSNGSLKYLASTYNPMALKTQLIFLINRFNQQLEMKQKDLFQKIMVSNYIFYKDGIYAHTVLNDEDLDIYKKILSIFSEKIFPCNLVVYLQTSFSEMMQRIYKSGSEY